MSEPKEYIIQWAIDGEARFTAESKEEAVAMFETHMDMRTLAEEGILTTDEPMTQEELDAMKAKYLKGISMSIN